MYKKITAAVLVGMLSSSVVCAGEEPYVAFDIIDLGVIERDPTDELEWVESSFGVAINSANRIAGSAVGSIRVISVNPISGEESVLNRVLAQPVRFDFDGTSSTVNNFMPLDGELGIGVTNSGFVPVDINSASMMAAYAEDTEVFEFFSKDADGECNSQSSQSSQNARKAVILSELGEATEIPLAENFLSMTASAISEAGQIVGRGTYITARDECTDPDDTATRGFIYEPSDQSVQVIGTLENEGDNQTTAISNISGINGGTIVGSTNFLVDGNRVLRGFISSLPSLEMTRIDGLGGNNVSLNDINDNGIAAGGTTTEDNFTIVKQAFLYNSNNDTTTVLGFLSEQVRFPFSDAFSLNTHAEVVGTSRITQTPDSFEAFLYDNGEIVNLNTLVDCDAGWTLTEARDINDDGNIVGTGTKLVERDGALTGEVRAFLLVPRSTAANQSCNPVVETSGGTFGFWLILLGLVGLRQRV